MLLFYVAIQFNKSSDTLKKGMPIVALISATLFIFALITNQSSYNISQRNQIAQAIEQLNIPVIQATYWNAAVFEFVSEYRVQINPVEFDDEKCVTPFRFLTSEKRFKIEQPSKYLLIFESDLGEFIANASCNKNSELIIKGRSFDVYKLSR